LISNDGRYIESQRETLYQLLEDSGIRAIFLLLLNELYTSTGNVSVDPEDENVDNCLNYSVQRYGNGKHRVECCSVSGAVDTSPGCGEFIDSFTLV